MFTHGRGILPDEDVNGRSLFRRRRRGCHDAEEIITQLSRTAGNHNDEDILKVRACNTFEPEPRMRA